MTEPEAHDPRMSPIGVAALPSVPLRQALRSRGLPFLKRQVEHLAQVGIIALLFRVGLEGDPARLAGPSGRAARIRLPDMAVARMLAGPGRAEAAA